MLDFIFSLKNKVLILNKDNTIQRKALFI